MHVPKDGVINLYDTYVCLCLYDIRSRFEYITRNGKTMQNTSAFKLYEIL